ncbi:TIGR02757 family protein [uncultured Helicobacter sp.]|uniref:TIGR02757 family protein n=1 Tax=uncultured Helicobacter sp. TaxID=175537 RepID=UPI00374F8128
MPRQSKKDIPKGLQNLQAFLDSHYVLCNTQCNLQTPDPLIIVRKYAHHPHFAEIALLCALLSYGNAKQIVAFLGKLDFGLLDSHTRKKRAMPYYRFQSAKDIETLFRIFEVCIERGGIRAVFAHALERTTPTPYRILNAIYHSIATLRSIAKELGIQSRGVEFALGARLISESGTEAVRAPFNPKGKSPLKRWNLFVRWMVRDDAIDFGIWQDMIKPSELIIPLDTHTFKVGQKLGLLQRKSYDLAAALELTDSLRRFCPSDPVRYDFALYRIGQSGQI